MPENTYRIRLGVGSLEWDITSDDMPEYGPVDGFMVQATQPESDVQPVQPDPSECRFGIVAADAAELAAVAIGDIVDARLYSWSGASWVLDLLFAGRVAAVQLVPHDLGVVAQVQAVSYLADLRELSVGHDGYPAHSITNRLAAIEAEAGVTVADLHTNLAWSSSPPLEWGLSQAFPAADPAPTDALAAFTTVLANSPARYDAPGVPGYAEAHSGILALGYVLDDDDEADFPAELAGWRAYPMWAAVAPSTPGVLAPTGVVTPSPDYRDAVLADSPVVYYRLGDANGSTVMADSAPGGVAGVYSSTTHAGSTLLIGDTDGSYAPVAGATATGGGVTRLDPMRSGDWTVEAWVNQTSTTGEQIIAGRETATIEWSLRINAGKPKLYINAGAFTLTAPNAIPVNTTAHVVVTYSAATDAVRMYVDGVQVASGSYTFSHTPQAGSTLRIGAWSSAQARLVGRMDELAIYLSTLDPARVVAHYNAGRDIGLAQYGFEVDPAEALSSAWVIPSDQLAFDVTYTLSKFTGLTRVELAGEDGGVPWLVVADNGESPPLTYRRDTGLRRADVATQLAAIHAPSWDADSRWTCETFTWRMDLRDPGERFTWPSLRDWVTVTGVPVHQSPTGRDWLVGIVSGWVLEVVDRRVQVTLSIRRPTSDARARDTYLRMTWDDPALASLTWDQIAPGDTWNDWRLLQAT